MHLLRSAIGTRGNRTNTGGRLRWRQIGTPAAHPEVARELYKIPVPIAPGPFDGTWKSFTADKLKPEPDWWREAMIGVWFHWGQQSMGRKGRANNRFMYDQRMKRFGHP